MTIPAENLAQLLEDIGQAFIDNTGTLPQLLAIVCVIDGTARTLFAGTPETLTLASTEALLKEALDNTRKARAAGTQTEETLQ